ncbi:pentapeptide repeat-containing protein [Salipaludibacillus agaradhaerens]|uniref:pentapeptide repeat-containing protein n=1 Tax=Salipaludibacillus agaradhaerens TaxID=76935 RepID=UPI000997BDC1|nr:pentapeptide repeat-containing protein [Salipaludibacillus agaradhaerens]
MSHYPSTNMGADCTSCFGLCCVALPYAKSADFPCNKDSGVPCENLGTDFRCGIHNNLRSKGFRGCSVYECYGAGQKVSQFTYNGIDWRTNSELAKEMFLVFPIMQQLYEMLYYIDEALCREEAQPLHHDLKKLFKDTVRLTNLKGTVILTLDVQRHRVKVNEFLLKTSELVRKEKIIKETKQKRVSDFIGANLRRENLCGRDLRGALLIAADLRDADLSYTDLIGADMRDADIRGANLTGSLFLTQAQINSAKGNKHTKLPSSLNKPDHWLI